MSSSAPKIAIGCQGGGTHAAFEAGVLSEILKDMQTRKRFDLVGLSGTSAGALCAMMVWYGLAPKKGRPGSGSAAEAIEKINTFWAIGAGPIVAAPLILQETGRLRYLVGGGAIRALGWAGSKGRKCFARVACRPAAGMTR